MSGVGPVEYRFDEAIPVLRRTPNALDAILLGLPDSWIEATEGPRTWSPFDVVGHLIHGERTDWVPRIEHILKLTVNPASELAGSQVTTGGRAPGPRSAVSHRSGRR